MWGAMSQLNLSARVYHRILKLAQTIADLAGEERIQPAHLAVVPRGCLVCPASAETGILAPML